MISSDIKLFLKKEFCCGCGSCYCICENDAISMEIDEEGFWYPKIDAMKCIGCHRCEKVCPVKNKIERNRKKKVAIVTLYGNDNIGNKLQNYAMQEILKQRNYEVSTIDVDLEIPAEKFSMLNMKRSVVYLESIVWLPGEKAKKRRINRKRQKRFKDFSDKFLRVTDKINIYRIPEALKEEYDYFVVGSDQVWHNWTDTQEELNYYFLKFAERGQRICISPSFGFNTVNETIKKYYQKGLQGFPHLSCREESGIKLIKELTDRDAELLIDPTMMIPAEKWERLSSAPIHFCQGKYILVYLLGKKSANTRKIINDIAAKYQLKIIDVYNYSELQLYFTDPAEFIYLIENAELICTDSFHGCVFSMIFHKNFVCFDRNDEVDQCMENRQATLLNKFGLTQRFYKYLNEVELFSTKYEQFDSILEKEQTVFHEYLDVVFKQDYCKNQTRCAMINDSFNRGGSCYGE